MEKQDVELARAWAGKRDQAALDELYWRHADRVYNFARHASGSTIVAEDLVQETFLRAARAMGNYRNHASFSTWLLAIARNAYYDHGRKCSKRERDSKEQRLPVRPAAGPEQEVQAEELRETVRAAVMRLPEAQRLAVTLCNLQELPQREAAAILDWSVEKLKTVLFRARQRLKQELAPLLET